MTSFEPRSSAVPAAAIPAKSAPPRFPAHIHVAAFLESIRIARPDAVEADELRSFMWAEEQRGLAKPSIARALVAVKGLFRWLAGEGRLEKNRLDVVEGPKLWKRTPDFLSVEEV